MSVKSNIGVVTDGLVFYADAGNGNSYPGSGTTWTDLAGSDDGTLTNGPLFDSNNGGSIDFDGTNDYAEISGTQNLNFPISTNSATFSIFLKFHSVGSWTGLFNKNRSSSWIGLWMSSASKAVFGAPSSNLQGTTTLATGNWYNIVGVQLANTSRKIYVNGTLEATKTTSFGSTAATTENWMIGQATSVNEYLNGNVACASIYEKALTADEVLQNYNALKNRFV
tara:strand:- start:2351 stop:3022 length:672 start_codon:yes stop_codon:yes gene_type:complete